MAERSVTRKELLGGGAVAGVVALGAAPAAQAHGGDDGIVGSWTGTVTATDPPLGSFADLISFHEGGVVIGFMGTFESNIRNNEGAVVFTARGTINAERIEV